MTKRLSKILELVPNGVGVIDVGTDHAYLPIELAKSAYPGKLIASDINAEPVEKAINNVASAGFAGRIDIRLSDGLNGCMPDEVDTIVIAGMGGDTICGILDMAEWCMDERYTLIFQPMTKAEVLRYWLVNNGFSIKSEHRVMENGNIFQILTAKFGGLCELSDAELFTGQYELRTDTYFDEELNMLICRFEKAIYGMRGVERKAALCGLYTAIAAELKCMREKHGKDKRDI